MARAGDSTPDSGLAHIDQRVDRGGDRNDADRGTPVSELSFEQALDELDELVRQMEAGDLPLDRAIAAYRRGAELAQHCQARLAAAEQQISRLDGEVLRPLDPAELRGGSQ